MELSSAGTRHACPGLGRFPLAAYLLLVPVLYFAQTTAFTMPREPTKLSYNGHKVVRMQMPDWLDWLALEQIVLDALGQDEVDFWAKDKLESWVDVQVSAEQYTLLHQKLEMNNIPHYIHIKDVQELIDHENDDLGGKKFNNLQLPSSKGSRVRRELFSNEIIGTYARFHDIKNYLESVATNFPEIAEVTKIGYTHGNFPIILLKLGFPAPHEKPAMWIDATTHAREWITPSSVLYIIYKILDGYVMEDRATIALLHQMDWYILPVVNPDGYEWTHMSDRLWRKNLSPNTNTSCRGTDLNRNWDFQWGGVQASTDPCSNMYRGAEAGSELETQAVADKVRELSTNLLAFSTVHSYTQYFFIRWAYTEDRSPTYEDQVALGRKAVDAVVANGDQDYRVGQAYEYLYAYSGGSPDWAAGVAGIKYTFGIELRDKGTHGFLLPVDQVEPVGKELMAGMLVIADHLVNITCGGRNLSLAGRYNGGWNGSKPDCDVTEEWWLHNDGPETRAEADVDGAGSEDTDEDSRENNRTDMEDEGKAVEDDDDNDVVNNVHANVFPRNRAKANTMSFGALSLCLLLFLASDL